MADGSSKRRRGKASDAADVFRDDEVLAELRAAVDLAAIDRPAGPGRPEQPGRAPLDRACHQLLEIVRRRCPGLLPAEPLAPGAVAEPVPLQPKQAQVLLSLAARQAALSAGGGRVPPEDEQLPKVVLWQEGPDELLVEVSALRVEVGEGTVVVTIPVRCNEIPRQRGVVQVSFAVGTAQRPAGLLAAASEPVGPPVVVRRWGEALTALAWQGMLDAAGGVAAATGADQDGSPLIPVALAAGHDGLAVRAQARHPIDRTRSGQVVHVQSSPLTSPR